MEVSISIVIEVKKRHKQNILNRFIPYYLDQKDKIINKNRASEFGVYLKYYYFKEVNYLILFTLYELTRQKEKYGISLAD